MRYQIIIFDGVCNFCNGAINFIINRDSTRKFRFTPMQSALAKELTELHQIDNVGKDTFLLIKDGRCYIWTNAALEIARELDGYWYLCDAFRIIPRAARDVIYRAFARNRYALFGRTKNCMVPTPDVRDRFVGLETLPVKAARPLRAEMSAPQPPSASRVSRLAAGQRELEALGEPQLQIADLQLWIHGREFPDSQDYWDGNWLRATAYHIRTGSSIRVHGSFIHLGEIAAFLRQLRALYESLQGTAKLDCIEPELRVELVAGTGGHISVDVGITPEHLEETHRFFDGLDQTYLPKIISACGAILSEYPIRSPLEGVR